MSTTVASSSVPLTANQAAADNPGLGTLVALPREVRDEIYRYLVKGVYQAICPTEWTTGHRKIESVLTRSEKSGLDLSTLQLSKAIHHEAVAVHYSEDIFLCCLDDSEKIVCLPQASIDRMMKIELEVLAGAHALCKQMGLPEDSYQDEAWGATIKKLNGTNLLRKTINVKVRVVNGPISLAVSSKTLHGLRTLPQIQQYRTVIVEIFSGSCVQDGFDWDNGLNEDDAIAMHEIGHNECVGEELELLTEFVKGELEPVLGPAALGHARMPARTPGLLEFTSHLKFHPREHLATISDT